MDIYSGTLLFLFMDAWSTKNNNSQSLTFTYASWAWKTERWLSRKFLTFTYKNTKHLKGAKSVSFMLNTYLSGCLGSWLLNIKNTHVTNQQKTLASRFFLYVLPRQTFHMFMTFLRQRSAIYPVGLQEKSLTGSYFLASEANHAFLLIHSNPDVNCALSPVYVATNHQS